MAERFKDTEIGSFLQKVAPTLIDTVGEAFPPAKLLKGLVNSDPTITPEDRAKVEGMLQEYEIKRLNIQLADIQDARSMQEKAMKQGDKFTKRFIYYLAAGSLLLGFAYIFFITFTEIPAANTRFADTILGVVIATIITSIYQFFFGSSEGSKKKDDMKTGLK